MGQFVWPSLVNGTAVAAGLFVLWSLVGGMKAQPAAFRAQAAIFAGVVSAAVTFVISSLVAGAAG